MRYPFDVDVPSTPTAAEIVAVEEQRLLLRLAGGTDVAFRRVGPGLPDSFSELELVTIETGESDGATTYAVVGTHYRAIFFDATGSPFSLADYYHLPEADALIRPGPAVCADNREVRTECGPQRTSSRQGGFNVGSGDIAVGERGIDIAPGESAMLGRWLFTALASSVWSAEIVMNGSCHIEGGVFLRLTGEALGPVSTMAPGP